MIIFVVMVYYMAITVHSAAPIGHRQRIKRPFAFISRRTGTSSPISGVSTLPPIATLPSGRCMGLVSFINFKKKLN